MIKGMIFAAGLGSRLKPITETLPKSLVEVGGKPMLRRVIDKLVAAGVEQIVVNVHHFADKVENYINSIADETGAEIVVSDERTKLLDTGGGLLAARQFLADSDAIVLHNADILSDASLDMMIAYHFYRRGIATLMVNPQRESSRRLLFQTDLRLRGRINLSTGATTPQCLDAEGLEKAAFSGIHVVSPEIFGPMKDFAMVSDKEAFSITDFYAEQCHRLNVFGYVAEQPSMWFDVGRPESLAKARAQFTPQV